MKSLYVVDGNNWFRRRAETDLMGTPVRTCFNEIQYRPETVVIVCWDGFNCNAKRRELFPDYKAKRQAPGESIFASQDLLKKALKLSRAIQVTVDGFEGDDVIANIVDHYKKKVDKIFIESNDADLRQLDCDMAREKFPEEPQWIQLYKTMIGDPSDSIPGAKGFGKGSWEKLDKQQKQVLDHIVTSGHGLTEDEIDKMVSEFYPKAAKKWFLDKKNREQLLVYYKIIGFQYIDFKIIEENMLVGYNTPHMAEDIFRKFMI